ncbi:transporter [Maribacter sp. 2210JD10-5]|uniref:transporter n=1 Tax=Maribacter sp. 2210JD10-5 TaxID=3386272 RepID=UPI0039BCA00F
MKSKTVSNFTALCILLSAFLGYGQYTDVINSNRPGLSVSAYAVGKNVIQAELGAFYEQTDHSLLNTESDIWGTDISLRYGLFFETLELNYEGTFQSQDLLFTNFDFEQKRTDFSRNRLGLKFLIFDPFKNPEANKPNLYSWKANNKFSLKNLIPAISIYGGANFVLGDNPFYAEDPTTSYRVMLATQSKLSSKFVLITNTAYDRIGTDFPELSYLISLSHAFRNPKWSFFAEHQGIQSDRYSDVLLRGGIAHLLSKKLQVDFNLGASFKNTPSRIFVGFGGSYRIDLHTDKLIPIENQKAGQNNRNR